MVRVVAVVFAVAVAERTPASAIKATAPASLRLRVLSIACLP